MNTNKKNHAVKVIAVALTAVMSLFGSATFANGGGSSKASTVKEAQVSVTYQGVFNNNVVFKVDYENQSGQKFWLIIKNDNGDVVFHRQFSDVHFSKTVYFQDTDSEINPTFVIRADNSEAVRQFQVNNIIDATVATGL